MARLTRIKGWSDPCLDGPCLGVDEAPGPLNLVAAALLNEVCFHFDGVSHALVQVTDAVCPHFGPGFAWAYPHVGPWAGDISVQESCITLGHWGPAGAGAAVTAMSPRFVENFSGL